MVFVNLLMKEMFQVIKMIIYADVIFITNFISTIALILIYSLIFQCKRHIMRYVISSMITGAYAIAELVFALPYVFRILVLVIVVAIAFGRISILYNTARFVFITIAVQGIFVAFMGILGSTSYIVNGTVTVFSGDLISGIVYVSVYPIMLCIRRVIKARSGMRYGVFIIGKKRLTLTLLYDSGNLLMHKGLNVAVVSWSAIRSVLDCDTYAALTDTAQDVMVFNTVGDSGVMPVITPVKSVIDGKEVKIYIAVTERNFHQYDGIIGI